MYEQMTFEVVMDRLLRRAAEQEQNLDTRVGSVIYSALAPAAVEIVNLYLEADSILSESFADTASRDFLVRRAGERGLSPLPATKALLKGEFSGEIPLGSRFSCGGLTFAAVGRMGTGSCRMECETPGEEGNNVLGKLIPIDYIEGLSSAALTELLIPGEDEEETENFRKRYFESLDTQAFGGNAADYKGKVETLAGVGSCKVYPAWKGGGTVRIVLLDSRFRAPSGELVDRVQELLDPPESPGQGIGLAPIGHRVTVAPALEREISVGCVFSCEAGWDFEAVKPRAEEAVDQYFSELSKGWADTTGVVVRVSQVETRLLDLVGVLDVRGTTINGAEENLLLGPEEIPVRGTVHG